MRVFVAMPFAKSFDEHWQIIQNVCQKEKIQAFRVDKNLSFERHIDIAIRREIKESDFVIALLTGDKSPDIPNPNVAFEIGYAQGLGMETILFAEKIEHLPFDFKQQRTCIYDGDMDTFHSGLAREISLLKKMMSDAESENVQNAFKEIIRCLRITLPVEYSLFKEQKGFRDNKIWMGIDYSKYVMHYVVSMGNPQKISTMCWLRTRELRTAQREFYKKQYNYLQRQLGHDVFINLHVREVPMEEASTTLEFRNAQLIKEDFIATNKALDTKDALKIALRISDYVQAFEPINRDFHEQHKNEIEKVLVGQGKLKDDTTKQEE